MITLADRIEAQRDAIVQAWSARAREDSRLERASDSEVRGFMPRFVRELVLALRAGVAPVGSPAVQEHAQQRRGLGVSQEALVGELRTLRSIALEGSGPSSAELRIFDDTFFVAISDTAMVLALDAMKDSLAQADMARLVARQREAEQHALLAQQLAQASAKQLRTIADAVPVLISWVGADERYVFVNKTYEQWFKKAREDVEGKPAIDIIGAAAYAVMKTHIHRALRGERFTFVQKGVPYPEGTRDIQASFIPQLDAGGRVDGFVVLMEDLAERLVR